MGVDTNDGIGALNRSGIASAGGLHLMLHSMDGLHYLLPRLYQPGARQ